MKKILISLFLVAASICFADYKTDFKYNLTDLSKIEKGLADATTAKDNRYIAKYTLLKSLIGKNETNITYSELKSVIYNTIDKISDKKNAKWLPPHILEHFIIVRFNGFIPDIAKDGTLYSHLDFIKLIVLNNNVVKSIGEKEWRRLFVSQIILNNKKFNENINLVTKFINIYEKNVMSFTSDEVKTDCALFKRIWFKNITTSEEWKKILVKIEIMTKSVQ